MSRCASEGSTAFVNCQTDRCRLYCRISTCTRANSLASLNILSPWFPPRSVIELTIDPSHSSSARTNRRVPSTSAISRHDLAVLPSRRSAPFAIQHFCAGTPLQKLLELPMDRHRGIACISTPTRSERFLSHAAYWSLWLCWQSVDVAAHWRVPVARNSGYREGLRIHSPGPAPWQLWFGVGPLGLLHQPVSLGSVPNQTQL